MIKLNHKERKYINSFTAHTTLPPECPVVALADIKVEKGGIVSDIDGKRDGIQMNYTNQSNDFHHYDLRKNIEQD